MRTWGRRRRAARRCDPALAVLAPTRGDPRCQDCTDGTAQGRMAELKRLIEQLASEVMLSPPRTRTQDARALRSLRTTHRVVAVRQECTGPTLLCSARPKIGSRRAPSFARKARGVARRNQPAACATGVLPTPRAPARTDETPSAHRDGERRAQRIVRVCRTSAGWRQRLRRYLGEFRIGRSARAFFTSSIATIARARTSPIRGRLQTLQARAHEPPDVRGLWELLLARHLQHRSPPHAGARPAVRRGPGKAARP